MILSAMFLAIALYLPFLTGQLRMMGNALCPMHLPVILCGFLCGPVYGAAVGFVAPLLRFHLFGMPPLMPIGVAMSFELMTYGAVCGMLYGALPKKKNFIYIALLFGMLSGRVVWGVVTAFLYGISGKPFGLNMFVAGAFLNAVPGIVIQIVLVPLIVMAVKKSR